MATYPTDNGSLRGESLFGNMNQYLAPEDCIKSLDGNYTLVYQTDGNLVLYNPSNTAVWASNTNGQPAWRTYMQPDGNFVVYSAQGQPVWASNSNNHPNCFLNLDNNGALTIKDQDYNVIWSAN